MTYNGYATQDAFHAALQARWAELRNAQREAQLRHSAAQATEIYRLFSVKDVTGTRFAGWSANPDLDTLTSQAAADLINELAALRDKPAELPYGLQLGQHLTDGHGLWRVDIDGLTDLAGGDDWDWEGIAANGGLGVLRPIADDDAEDEGEIPDSYLDGVDGHWYVCRYDRTLPQIHARDCETCAAESGVTL